MNEEPDARMVLWRQLVLRAARRGVPYVDAQDLAGQAFLKALESFDESRGTFAPLCRTIHANLLKNYWRDRKPTREFDPDRDDPGVTWDPIEDFVESETRSRFRAIAENVLADLTPEQAAFFLALRDAIGAAEYGAVSEAARRLGLEPLRGHDLYRQIQRKARRHLQDFVILAAEMDVEALGRPRPEPPPADSQPAQQPPATPGSTSFRLRGPAAPRPEPPPDSLLLLAVRCATAGFERFDASLTEAQRLRLVSVLG